jgi:PKD repeat protein
MKKTVLLGIALLTAVFFTAQNKDYAVLMHDSVAPFKVIQGAFEKQWEGKDHKVKAKGWKAFKRWEYFHKNRVDANGNLVNIGAKNYEEYNKFFRSASNQATQKTASSNNLMASGNWTYIGPPGGISGAGGGAGRTTFIRFDPNNSSIMYAGSPAGGLWKSTNGGSSWSVLCDQLASLGCSDLAIDPSNSSILYMATGDADGTDTYSFGVMKSIDAGVTWNTTGLVYSSGSTSTISRLLIDPSNPQTLYAATSSGIMKTTDGAINWYNVKTGVYKDLEFKPFHSSTIYACTSGSFFVSRNSGTTWTSVTTNFPATIGRSSIAVTPADSQYVYMLGSLPASAGADAYGFGGLIRSTDGAATFTLMSSTPNIMGWNTSGSDQGGQGWYDIALAVSPTSKNTIFTGGVNVWKSTNGGTTMTNNTNWWGTGSTSIHADQHYLEFLPGSGTTLFAANDGGVYKTTNTGTGWTDVSTGLQIAQQYNLGVSQTNSALTVTGWQDNGINLHNTTNCSEILGADGFECIISWASSSVIYGESYYGDINKSTTGGGSFSNIVSSGGTGVDEDGAWNTPYIQHPTASGTLLVGKSQVYRSTNSGTSWAQVGTLSGNGLLSKLAYAPSNPNYIYVTDGGGLWVSTNGTSFTNKSTLLPAANITGFGIDASDPSIVYISSSGYNNGNKVFVTKDAGNTWQNYSTGLPNVPCNDIVFQAGTYDALYLGTDVGVFYRDSTMSNWIAYSDGMPNVVISELEIQVSAGKLRAATYGRGLWETDLYTAPTSAPVANFTSNRSKVCMSKSIDFTDLSTNLPSTWNWTFTGGTPSTSTLQYPTVSYSVAGTYPVTLVSSNVAGSDSVVDSTYVTVYSNPSANAGPDMNLCKGDTIQLQASGGITFLWGTATTLSNLAVPDPLAYPTSTKVYNVTVSDSNGCKATDYMTLFVIAPFANPTISVNGILLTANPSGTTLSYQWYYNGILIPNGTTKTISADSVGAYYVVVSDTTGCFSLTSPTHTTTGLLENATGADWNFYPNPSEGQINITVGKDFNETAVITIYNVEGKLVAKESKQFKSGETYQLKNDLPAGVFYAEIKDHSGKIIAQRKLMVLKD